MDETRFRAFAVIALFPMKPELAVTRAVSTHTMVPAVVRAALCAAVLALSVIGTRAHQIHARKAVARVWADSHAAVVS